jgi:hypothetical protein
MWRGLSQATSFEASLQGEGRKYRLHDWMFPPERGAIRARLHKRLVNTVKRGQGRTFLSIDTQYGSAVRAPKIAAISSMPRRYSSSVKAALVAL